MLICKYFLEPFVFTAVAVTAGGLSIFLLFKFPSDRDSGRVNKESKKVSGPGEAGVWRLMVYTCTVTSGRCSEGQTSGERRPVVTSGAGVMRVRGWTRDTEYSLSGVYTTDTH